MAKFLKLMDTTERSVSRQGCLLACRAPMRFLQRASGTVFVLAVAALIPFWAVKGTEPAGDAVMWILYGVAGTSALIWLITASLRHLSDRRSGPRPEEAENDFAPSTPTGIRVRGGSDIEIRGNRIAGYEHGISASDVENLETMDNLIVGPSPEAPPSDSNAVEDPFGPRE
jgi:hypothetical protein